MSGIHNLFGFTQNSNKNCLRQITDLVIAGALKTFVITSVNYMEFPFPLFPLSSALGSRSQLFVLGQFAEFAYGCIFSRRFKIYITCSCHWNINLRFKQWYSDWFSRISQVRIFHFSQLIAVQKVIILERFLSFYHLKSEIKFTLLTFSFRSWRVYRKL